MSAKQLETEMRDVFKEKHLLGDYYLGLTLNTSAVGWAVVNAWYEVLKCRNRSLWGVRLFDAASTAEDRRMKRSERRRLNHKNWRISILEEIFSEEIASVDPGYFLRMKESKYYPEDKRDMDGKCPELPYSLFVDKDYTDKDYHKQFPTIYHLIQYLMNTKDNPDIRLVYNAIHFMLKHRGHFVLSGDLNQVIDFPNTFNQFLNNVKNEELDFHLTFDENALGFVKNTLKDKNLPKSKKKTALVKEFNATTACEKALFSLITGGTADLSTIFGRDDLKDDEHSSISFESSKYDEESDAIEELVGEQYYVIESAKVVYDWAILSDILGMSKDGSLSSAKVAVYEKHKNDLAFLKKIIRKYLTPDDYNKVFCASEKNLNNYCSYVGTAKINGKKVATYGKHGNFADFADFLKKNILAKLPDGKDKKYLQEELEKGTFLPLQKNKGNSVIPYQIHLYELQKILDNIGSRNAFIRENAEHIVELFTFRVPYYVGPVQVQTNSQRDKFSWAVRRTNDKIYPWNFSDVIDLEASATKFIRCMTNKCTYLYSEDVIPKDSLLYSKYTVLNELNNLRLDGKKISVSLKQQIYNELFCKNRKVTRKKLRDFLVKENIADKNVEITGIDGDFQTSLKAYHDFKEKLTGVELSDSQKEEIILNISLFGDDKKLLRQRLKKMFPSFTEKQIKAISMLSYKGWGKFSRKFLEDIIAVDPDTKEKMSIMDALWKTNENLMQLLSNHYGYLDVIARFNAGEKEKALTYETVQSCYASPAVKKQIWSALRIVIETKQITGKDPKRAFIKVSRGSDGSGKKESRKKQLLDLYKKCAKKEDPERMKELMEQLEQFSDAQLRSDAVYLYFTQMGRCMYTGHVIPISQIWNRTMYNRDHIFPKSKTMDDSLDNLVLVEKGINRDKDDAYPISKKLNISPETIGFWKKLKDYGFISSEKYNRLVRQEDLSPDELAGFIDRQLVETRQSSKIVAEILKEALPHTEIVYVKAKNVSDFRRNYQLPKISEMNDYHYAKDAYLNVVVGNAYYTKFSKDAARFIRENPGRSYSLTKLFDYDIKRGGETAWITGSQGTILQVHKTMAGNDILVARKVNEVTSGQNGGLFDQNPLKKGNGQIPLKSSDDRLSDISKYGGYSCATGAYFVLADSVDEKGRTKRSIEFVPLHLKRIVESSDEAMIRYLEEERGLINPKIVIHKIKKNTLFKVNGFYMWLSGRSSSVLQFRNANQLVLDYDDQATLKEVLKFIERRKENKKLTLTDHDKVEADTILHLYDTFTEKLLNTVYAVKMAAYGELLKEQRKTFIGLSLEDKCVVTNEILHLLQCQSMKSNLTLIGGSPNAGGVRLNSNITDLKDVKNLSIINQSVTGFYEQEVNLLMK